MLAELFNPPAIQPKELDAYLADGWFRMGQSIFTTNFLKFNEIIYSAIWLRVDLSTFEISKSQQKLVKLNSKFDVKIQQVMVTPTHEALFAKYREHISFDAASSLQQLLYHNGSNDIYDTLEVDIYDGDQLIACGYFDLGERTSAGISCFYDPDYKKYSLGRYLMFLKMEFSKKAGLDFFYLGYFAPGYPLFDYKLDLAKPSLEYLDLVTDVWKPIAEFLPEGIPLDVMTDKLKEIGRLLKDSRIKTTFFYYEFFDADLINSLNGLRLFDFPVFLYCYNVDESVNSLLVVFDVRDSRYHLIICDRIYRTHFDIGDGNRYNTHLLQLNKVVFSTESAETMTTIMVAYLRRTASGDFYVVEDALIKIIK